MIILGTTQCPRSSLRSCLREPRNEVGPKWGRGYLKPAGGRGGAGPAGVGDFCNPVLILFIYLFW